MNSNRLLHLMGIFVTSIIILLCITGCRADAFPSTLRTLFANKLHIKEEDTSVIDKSMSDSGMYYGVYIRVLYEDGSQSEKFDCRLDDNNNIIAYSWESLLEKKIKEIQVKDLVMTLE